MIRKFKAIRLPLALILACLAASPALADRMDQALAKLEALSAEVRAQREMLQRQALEIQRLKKALNSKAPAPAPAPAAQAPTAPEPRPAPAAETALLRDFLGDRFKFATDLRLRYEGLYDRKYNGGQYADRHRFRIRWRIFADYKVNPDLFLRSMLTTSSGSWFDDGKNSRNWQPGRTSNQSMDDEFNNKNVFIGRIYAQYQPRWAPGLEITAGKFKNTFLHTDLMWDPDVNPEGAYERYQFKGWRSVRPFVHFGQMAAAENSKTADSYLFLWQAGADLNLGPRIKWTLAGSYYDWQHLNQSDMSAVDGSSAGNSVGADGKYLYDYKLVQGLTFLDFKLQGAPVRLWLDYIKNLAGGVPGGRDAAWSAGFMLGKAREKGDLAFYFKYARIESDALVGALSDGDFGGADRVGYKAQFRYMIWNPLQLRLSWFQTDSLDGPEAGENRFQTDFIFKFNL